ncbi:MAG: zeta toxin family protein [Methylococcales bacterium]|nr:zeta toxin family protein [Methylococcales bacterium]
MNKNTIPRIKAYKQLKKLRTALAIAQGAKLLSTLQQEAEGTVSHDQTKRVTYLTELFSRIHREMYQDWKEQPTVVHRPGTMTDADKRKEFREAIESLVLDGDDNKDTAIFDNNGFVISTENIADRLANFYQKMRSVRPFAYGNRLSLDFFITMLGKLPAIKSVYEQGIDFRRIGANDAAALHNPMSTFREITLAFQHALDPSLCKSLQNIPNDYGKWPENKKFVYGIPFLSHKTDCGIECLVTVNGGMVPMDLIKKEFFIPGKHLADYPLCPSENMIGYLPGTEDVRKSGSYEIDGISIGIDGAAPLFCLDINMLTGLRSPGHTEVLQLLKRCEGENSLIFDLVSNDGLKDKMINSANGDIRLIRAVEIAYERLTKIIKQLADTIETLFEGKTSDANPSLFMSMGGAGSGKTAVEEIALAHCGDNFVTASLDEFRKKSDLYKILTAASHHSDDYVYVEPFANRLRDLVADHAKRKHINILYDGTGIPYQPRYSNIVNQFKASGFYTQITAVDAFIVKPESRENELIRSSVITSVKERYETDGRALPWVVTVDKHIRAPRSFLNALEHEMLNKISLFANDGEKNKHYLVAESFFFSDLEVMDLKKNQLAGNLLSYLYLLIRDREDSILKKLTHGDDNQLEELISRNPNFTENNIAFQIYPNKNGNRVLLIYSAHRMVDFIEKRQLNPNASGEKGLLHKPESLSFYVDPYTKYPWITKLQN